MLKKLKKRLISVLVVLAMVVTSFGMSDVSLFARTGDQTAIEGNPKILFYEVPEKFVDGSNLTVPRNVTFTLNANRDVVWSAQVVTQVEKPEGAEEVTIDPITGIVHVPYNTYQQTITVTAISNDGTNVQTSFFIYVTNEVATIESVEYDWETAKKQAVDVQGESLLNFEKNVLTVYGKVNDVNIPYKVYPEYINDKNIKLKVANNNNISFGNDSDEYDSYVYNYDNKLRLEGDPDGYVTLNTITNETIENPMGTFDSDSQANAEVRTMVLNDSGLYTIPVNSFKPQVTNVKLHYFVTNNKTDEITDSDDMTINDYKTITLNANNELDLTATIANDITWFDAESSKIVDFEKTKDTMTFYYWTGEIENKKSMVEISDGKVLGNIGYENTSGTKPTIDKEYVEANKETDPFQRKMTLQRTSPSTIKIKTALAVPKVNDDVKEVKNVWICVQMTPKNADGDTIGGKSVEVLYCLVLNMAKEEPAAISLDLDDLRREGNLKTETQYFKDGSSTTVHCIADNDGEGGDDGRDVYLALGSPELDKAAFVSLDYYNVEWNIRSAETLDGLRATSFEKMDTDLSGRHKIPIGNELGYWEVQVELTATELGKRYGLGENMLSVSYYFEVIPNIADITLSNELDLSTQVVMPNSNITVNDTDTEVVHAMIGQTLQPDCDVTTFYQTYDYGFGNYNPVETKITDFQDKAESYIERGLIKFHSLNENVASVDSAGVITAHKPGVAYVLVYSEPAVYEDADVKFMEELGFDMQKYVCGGTGTIAESGSSMFRYSASKYIKVVVNEDQIKLTDIKISSVKARATNNLLSIVNTDTLEVNGKTSFTLNVSTTPVDAATPEVTWSSSDTSIAKVNKTTGEVSTFKAGNVEITATLKSDPSIKATQQVVVKAVALSKITGVVVDSKAAGADKVSGMTNSGTVDAGNSFTLKVVTDPTNATEDGGITWVSSDENVATVDKNGVVTAVSSGKAEIKVCITANPAIFAVYEINVVGNVPTPDPKPQQSNTPLTSESPDSDDKKDESENPDSDDKKDENEKPDSSQKPVTSEKPKEEAVTKGDVDEDKEITLEDAQMVLKAALKIINIEGVSQKAADVDGDGEVSLTDAQLVLKFALKIINTFE